MLRLNGPLMTSMHNAVMLYSIQENNGSACVIMQGPFTFRDSPHFAKMLKILQRNAQAVEVRMNLGRLESLDAMALGLLLLAFDTFKRKHLPLVFEQAHGKVLESINAAARYNALSIAA